MKSTVETLEPTKVRLTVEVPYEELTLCDPACGSGHILVYAFDLLFEIYQEEGYFPAPKLK